MQPLIQSEHLHPRSTIGSTISYWLFGLLVMRACVLSEACDLSFALGNIVQKLPYHRQAVATPLAILTVATSSVAVTIVVVVVVTTAANGSGRCCCEWFAWVAWFAGFRHELTLQLPEPHLELSRA